jgi:hypothetical protein
MTDVEAGVIVSSYVSKYMTKNVQTELRDQLKQQKITHVRFIQPSQGWYQLFSEQSERQWTTGQVSFAEFMTSDKDYYDIQLERDLEAIDFDNPLSVYPFDV